MKADIQAAETFTKETFANWQEEALFARKLKRLPNMWSAFGFDTPCTVIERIEKRFWQICVDPSL